MQSNISKRTPNVPSGMWAAVRGAMAPTRSFAHLDGTGRAKVKRRPFSLPRAQNAQR